ncbi:hypothetical protein J3R83DRAFT_11235 [Lanmaoa asiatica]|nr:hypothetical protein J3R83DRAFT_11235 [Lanmaoa asiatica]
MSNAASLQQTPDSDEWDYILTQLEEQRLVREQVSKALREANAAFAAQFTQPDAYKYADACDRLTNFLDLKIQMDDSEQRLVACAMHENAVNNPALSKSERSAHSLASTSLVPLCNSALDGVTQTEPYLEVLNLSCRAEQALSKAAEALDLSKYLDFGNMKDDDFSEFGNRTGETSAARSPVPAASKPATPRASIHDITDVGQTPRSAKLKQKALVVLNDRPPLRGAPLGRAHTMPTLSQATSSSHYSRTGRASSKAHSRRHGLAALQETEE